MIKAGMMKAAYQRKLLLTFEGADGATTWPELAQGLTIDYNTGNLAVLDDAQKYSGNTSLLCPPGTKDVGYRLPVPLSGSATYIGRFRYEDGATWIYPFDMSSGGVDAYGNAPHFGPYNNDLDVWYAYFKDREGNTILDEEITTTIAHDTWVTFKYITNNRDISLYIDDVFYKTWTAGIDNAWAGVEYFWWGNYSGAGYDMWLDQVEWNCP
jgi:hypothetical protein